MDINIPHHNAEWPGHLLELVRSFARYPTDRNRVFIAGYASALQHCRVALLNPGDYSELMTILDRLAAEAKRRPVEHQPFSEEPANG